MKIFYINSKDFLKSHDTDFLRRYADDREFKSTKRFIQYSLGRYLVKCAAKDFYGLANPEIIIENEKPKFKDSGIHFSISHSGDYVAAAFDEHECGLDIEEMKPRDLEPLCKRYEKDFSDLEDFYKFWTEYEAEIKLQDKPQGKYSCVFQDDYMLTAVSTHEIGGLKLAPLPRGQCYATNVLRIKSL